MVRRGDLPAFPAADRPAHHGRLGVMAEHPIPFDPDAGRRVVEITPDWLLTDVLNLFPGAASVIDRYFGRCPEHPGCRTCPGRAVESIDEAAWLSGAEDHIEELVAELNECYRQWLDGEPFWGTTGSS
jgi:hypothetical protein